MKLIISFILVLSTSTTLFAQFDYSEEDTTEEIGSKFSKSKLYYGGYLDVAFGTYTVIGASPLLGYKFSPKFSLGSQLTYKYFGGNQNSQSNYGASIFSRYRIIPQLYLHTEFSAMNYKFYSYTNGKERSWVPFWLVGGGYSQPISENTWLNTQVLFDVIQHKKSPYKKWKPFWSIGFGVGF